MKSRLENLILEMKLVTDFSIWEMIYVEFHIFRIRFKFPSFGSENLLINCFLEEEIR